MFNDKMLKNVKSVESMLSVRKTTLLLRCRNNNDNKDKKLVQKLKLEVMKEREIAEIAKRMKSFEEGITYESKDVTIRAFWHPESDGSGVYVVDYFIGKVESEANISYGGEDYPVWGCDSGVGYYDDETPKMFQNILHKLVEFLNKKELSRECKEYIKSIRYMVKHAKENVDDFLARFEIELLGKVGKVTNDDEPIMCSRCIEPFKILCGELNIEVPYTCDVFLRKGCYELEYYGFHKATCKRVDEVEEFMRKWVNRRVDDVANEAERKIDLLLS
mgnify:FL=1